MKRYPIFSVALLVGLTAGAVAMNSCGDDASAPIDPDARPRIDAQYDDSGVKLNCIPESGTNLALEEVVRGLENPVFLDAPKGDSRLFVVEQPGRIVIISDGAQLATPFLDIQMLVRDLSNEQGLLGLAFHPDYAQNGRFFVNYTAASPSGNTVVAEYTVSADANIANTSGKIILTFDQPESNHNGGMLAFGADNKLYISTGDGGGGGDQHNGQIGNGQSLTTLLGKMLRIDVDTGSPYSIPADNPYAAGGGSPEIWAYGLRNPWRFSFDRTTGDMYIGDVGQQEREEINVVAGSAANVNYGWKIVEGAICYNAGSCNMTGKVAPVHDYPHTEGRQAVTGGYVYRGDCLPDIKGRYFFGDYSSSQIYTFVYQGGAATQLEEITDSIDPSGDIARITSFGEDGFGELYVVARNGKVFRIVSGN